MALISVGNRKLQFFKSGKGPRTIILIPGGPGLTLDYLSDIHDHLPSDEFTVVSYNPSGTVGNKNAPFYKSVKGYADELQELLTTLQIESCSLLGHSWGGVILQEFLLQFPEYPLQSVILSNSFTSGSRLAQCLKERAKDLPTYFHEQRAKYLTEGDGAAIDQLIGEYWFPKFVCRINPYPENLIKSLTPLADTPMYYYYLGHDLLNINGAILNWNVEGKLNTIKCPVLLISGEHDYMTLADNQQMVTQFPQAELSFLPGTSHLPMIENPELYCNTLLAFMVSQNQLKYGT